MRARHRHHSRRHAGGGDGGGGRRRRLRGRISYIYQERPLGIAHTIILARDFLAGDPFVLYLGDNFLPEGISDYAQHFRGDSANCQVLLSAVPNPQDFGIAEMEGGRDRCKPRTYRLVLGDFSQVDVPWGGVASTGAPLYALSWVER